jgi:energy-converting hydrogenase Eha subunit C
MGRAAFLIIALASAAMVAMMTGSVAHDEFGIPLDTIRMDALSAAGLIFAAVACGSLLKWKK